MARSAGVLGGALCVGLCVDLPRSAGQTVSQPATRPATQAVSRESEIVKDLDRMIEKREYAVVLQKIARLAEKASVSAEIRLRAARAHLGLGEAFGATQVRRIEGGEPGRFVDQWFVVEATGRPDEFLCAPPASAINQVRRAIDGGADSPAAQRLFAEIWLAAKRPKCALAVLRSHERPLMDDNANATLTLLAQANLAANDVDAYLDAMQRLAQGAGPRRDAVLAGAYFAAADVYNLRGDAALHREFLRRALKLAPDTEARMLELGDALWEAGEKAEARRWYRKLIDREPAHPERLRILERISE